MLAITALLAALAHGQAGTLPTYKVFPGINCFAGHGGVDIDKAGTSMPPHTNITIDSCSK